MKGSRTTAPPALVRSGDTKSSVRPGGRSPIVRQKPVPWGRLGSMQAVRRNTAHRDPENEELAAATASFFLLLTYCFLRFKGAGKEYLFLGCGPWSLLSASVTLNSSTQIERSVPTLSSIYKILRLVFY